MKKITLILIALVMMALALETPCNAQASDVREFLREMNNMCPISMGIVGSINSVEYRNGNVYFTCSVDETYINIPSIKKNPTQMHDNLLTQVKNHSESMETLIEFLAENNIGMSYVYVGRTSGQKVTISLSAAEIREARKNANGQRDPLVDIDAILSTTLTQLPMEVEKGITLVNMYRTEDFLVYVYDVNELVISINDMENNRVALKTMLKSNLQQMKFDPAVSLLISLCLEANIGIRYLYVGKNSGNRIYFDLTTDDLE